MRKIRLLFNIVTFISLFFVCSCVSTSSLNFAKYKWSVDLQNGDIVNDEGTICFTYGNVLVDTAMPIIGDSDSVAMHKEMDKYLEKICKSFAINVDSILYYAPLQGVLYVEYKEVTPVLKPSSITTGMKQNENAHTMWVPKFKLELRIFRSLFFKGTMKSTAGVCPSGWGVRSSPKSGRIIK